VESQYDEHNPVANLVRMHQKVYNHRRQEEEERNKKKEEEEAGKKETKKKEAPTAPPKKKEKKKSGDPPINLLITLIGNVKIEIKNIHIRYEDDYFSHYKPCRVHLSLIPSLVRVYDR